jgi:hypothetical protein
MMCVWDKAQFISWLRCTKYNLGEPHFGGAWEPRKRVSIHLIYIKRTAPEETFSAQSKREKRKTPPGGEILVTCTEGVFCFTCEEYMSSQREIKLFIAFCAAVIIIVFIIAVWLRLRVAPELVFSHSKEDIFSFEQSESVCAVIAYWFTRRAPRKRASFCPVTAQREK